MRLTNFTDYSLRALMCLAMEPDRLITVNELAGKLNVPVNHLTKVVHRLGVEGDAITLRGQHGGIRLGRPAHTIIIGQVVRRTEPDFNLAPCFDDPDSCVLFQLCGLHQHLHEANAAFLAVLDRYTLADIIASPRRLPGLVRLQG